MNSDPARDRLDRLIPDLYQELRDIASHRLREERDHQTLRTTALVHEAYLRLAQQREVAWSDRGQVLGLAAQMMRRILVDEARVRGAEKRGGAAVKVGLESSPDCVSPQDEVDVLALNDALDRLAELNARQAKTVELRYFGGLSLEETAMELGASVATVRRDWRIARAWLFQRLALE